VYDALYFLVLNLNLVTKNNSVSNLAEHLNHSSNYTSSRTSVVNFFPVYRSSDNLITVDKRDPAFS